MHALQQIHGNVYRCVADMIPVLNNLETELVPTWNGNNIARKPLLDVYQTLIDLLPRLASLDMSLTRRIQVLTQARNLATRASSHAISLLQFDRAVELLESGRAVFWAQHLRLRTSIDSFNNKATVELRDISRRLEIPVGSNIPPDLDNNLAQGRIERDMAERRRLSACFYKLVHQVRSQPGMNQFLLNLDYKTLSSASSRGPLVIFLESWMCIITKPQTHPKMIRIREFSYQWLQEAAQTLRMSARRSRTRLDSSRGARKRLMDELQSHASEEYKVLAELWRRIAQPLIAGLGWNVSQSS
jgi:hypothetical protein